jgi:phosphoribosylglycinamide formyltransferase-1
MKKSIAIFASHNGSGYDVLYHAMCSNLLNIKISLVISNNSDSAVLEKAKKHGIDCYTVNGKKYENPDQKIYELLKQHNCEMIFLSGYMKKISPLLTNNFQIINSHPSLLPKYGGPGMYGRFVHEAVVQNNETQSGCSIHFVNENYDEGEIILQKSLTLASDESPESLEKRVKLLEKEAIIEAFELLLSSSK